MEKSAEYWKNRYDELLEQLRLSNRDFLSGGKERFEQLNDFQNYDWNSFLNGWIEGQTIFAHKIYQKEQLKDLMDSSPPPKE